MKDDRSTAKLKSIFMGISFLLCINIAMSQEAGLYMEVSGSETMLIKYSTDGTSSTFSNRHGVLKAFIKVVDEYHRTATMRGMTEFAKYKITVETEDTHLGPIHNLYIDEIKCASFDEFDNKLWVDRAMTQDQVIKLKQLAENRYVLSFKTKKSTYKINCKNVNIRDLLLLAMPAFWLHCAND